MNEEIHAVELGYPLSHHAHNLLWVGPEFVDPVDNDMPTNEERKLRDFDIESEEEEAADPKASGLDVHDDIDDAWSRSDTPPHYLVMLEVLKVVL